LASRRVYISPLITIGILTSHLAEFEVLRVSRSLFDVRQEISFGDLEISPRNTECNLSWMLKSRFERGNNLAKT
jgi:hypothetical protein